MLVPETAVPHQTPEGAPCPGPRGMNLEQLCPEKEPKCLSLHSPPCKAAAARAGPRSRPSTVMMKGEEELVCALISEPNLKTAADRHTGSQDA